MTRLRWWCLGCAIRRVRRRWSYCPTCVLRLSRGEQVDQDYGTQELLDLLKSVAPPPPLRSPRRRRGRRLAPGDPVHCDHYACTLAVKVCLQRQDARWTGQGWRAPIYGYCGGGECVQGARYRRITDYLPAEDWASRSKSRSTRYQSYRPDAGSQRNRMRLLALSRPEGEVPTIDWLPAARPQLRPLPEDDLGDLRAVEP